MINKNKITLEQAIEAYTQALKTAREKGNRQMEWEKYLSSLKTIHKAKRRLMQVLDSLEGKRIIDD